MRTHAVDDYGEMMMMMMIYESAFPYPRVRELRRVMEQTYDGPGLKSHADIGLELLLVHDSLDGAVSRRCLNAKSSSAVLNKCVVGRYKLNPV